MRRLDHDHDHRERLQDRRLTTYERFDGAFADYRRSHDQLANTMAARELSTRRIEQTPAGPDLVVVRARADEVETDFNTQLVQATAAAEELERALTAVRLVATEHVFELTSALKDVARQAWIVHRDFAGQTGGRTSVRPEDWLRVQDAEATVTAAQGELRAARRVELGVETIPHLVPPPATGLKRGHDESPDPSQALS